MRLPVKAEREETFPTKTFLFLGRELIKWQKSVCLSKIGTATQTIPSINYWLSVPTWFFLISASAFVSDFLLVSVFSVFCSIYILLFTLESCYWGSMLR